MYKEIKELDLYYSSLETSSIYDIPFHDKHDLLYSLHNKIKCLLIQNVNDKKLFKQIVDNLFKEMENINETLKKDLLQIVMDLIDNGELANLFTEEIFGYFLKRLNEVASSVEGFDDRILELEQKFTKLEEKFTNLEENVTNEIHNINTTITNNKTELEGKINKVEIGLNSKIQDTNNRLEQGFDRIDDEIDRIDDRLDAIGEGGGGSEIPPNIQEDINLALNNINYSNGVKGGRVMLDSVNCYAWVYTVPKDNVEFTNGFSKYYRTNDLHHSSGSLEGKHDIGDSISIHYNATIALTGSPYDLNGSGILGVNIDNGVIKNNRVDGWYTCGITKNNTLKFFKKNVTADTIKSQGINNAFSMMMPLVIDGAVVDEHWYNEHNSNHFNVDKHPRTVFGEDNKGNWFFMTVHGRTKGQKGVTYKELANILINKYKLTNACATDGGGSSEIIINHSKVNWNIENYGMDRRPLPHFLIFREQPKPINKMQQQIREIMELVSQLSDRVLRGESARGVFNEQLNGFKIGDLNEIKRSGLYWCTKDTPNSPGEISYGILHFEVEPGAMMQYAFPYADNGYDIKMRRVQGTQWGKWVVPKKPSILKGE